MILRTLAEMMAICYAKEETRCSRQLLHYQLCAHQHAILLDETVGYDLNHPKLPLVKWLQKVLVTTIFRIIHQSQFARALDLALTPHSGLVRNF